MDKSQKVYHLDLVQRSIIEAWLLYLFVNLSLNSYEDGH